MNQQLEIEICVPNKNYKTSLGFDLLNEALLELAQQPNPNLRTILTICKALKELNGYLLPSVEYELRQLI